MTVMLRVLGNEVAYPGKGIPDKYSAASIFLVNTETNRFSFFL